MRPKRSLSAAQARRLALAAQGFTTPRPSGRVDRRHLRRVVDQIGLIQIDSVNVVARSQDLVVFARLGNHPRNLIDDATAAGDLFEYWVHEASHVPTADHHLYRWSMDSPRRWGQQYRGFATERADYLDEIERAVAERGPVLASDLSTLDPATKRRDGGWWNYDEAKHALEILFDLGRVTAYRRRTDFARVYDLPERRLAPEVLARPEVSEHDARKELLMRAARSCGVGTDKDLVDYHRQNLTTARPLLAELVEEGRLELVSVEGWKAPGYLDPEAKVPRAVSARALLSPFDPVVWTRDRAERLFNFRYRIEIYTPAPKRQYGYYVLPFLLGDELVGRVDLKADRAAGELRVQAAWIEPGRDRSVVGPALADELREMADWLQLERVTSTGAGDLTVPLP